MIQIGCFEAWNLKASSEFGIIEATRNDVEYVDPSIRDLFSSTNQEVITISKSEWIRSRYCNARLNGSVPLVSRIDLGAGCAVTVICSCTIVERNALSTIGVDVTERVVANVRILVPTLGVTKDRVIVEAIRTCEPPLRSGKVPGAEVIKVGFGVAFFRG